VKGNCELARKHVKRGKRGKLGSHSTSWRNTRAKKTNTGEGGCTSPTPGKKRWSKGELTGP